MVKLQQKAEKQRSYNPEERQSCLPRWRPTRTLVPRESIRGRERGEREEKRARKGYAKE